MKRETIYFILLIAFSSCVKDLALNSEDLNSKIVVNSIFENGEKIELHLSESVSVIENVSTPVISNSKITISNESGDLLGESSSTSFYLSNFNTEAGQEYFLKVSADGFESVEAFAEIPPLASLEGIDTSIFQTQQKIQFDVSIDDNPLEDNYYSIKIKFLSTDNLISTNSIISFGRKEVVVNGEKSGTQFFFSDETFNGEVFTFSGLVDYFEPFLGWEYYIVEVNSLSRDLYNYRLSYYNYIRAQELPFTEPVQIYSNINNGIGIFAGYNVFRDTIWVN